ncbi:dienelactone hydrolase family protein [Quisquiliibacterium transsilvanicum]|uniref:Phospholipase/carboxylesterase n=1 Tax=Quisquiliibacterium transsilvanicum TaxID=1549638 RepID=A0A7W8HFN3_9BURK|nr:dienelactone hydrolase family protein [Quisquiliibacterium transsilvanicum]MBB5270982.1 phospholipase/carboxylesterase [Quisquiliibacterium transsilvanicum]
MQNREQLWLELPPMSPEAPRRLLVFLHGAGSSPEAFAPVALAWQLKFPGAQAAILQGPEAHPGGAAHDWFDTRAVAADRAERAALAAARLAQRVAVLQQSTGVDAERTVLVGFSQGATVALEMVRNRPGLAAIVVAYAGRLARPIRSGERLDATVHLLHGEFDSLVPVVHAHQALRALHASGTEATLDIVADSGHVIDQQLIILGTTRVMQTVFRGRRRAAGDGRTLH